MKITKFGRYLTTVPILIWIFCDQMERLKMRKAVGKEIGDKEYADG